MRTKKVKTATVAKSSPIQKQALCEQFKTRLSAYPLMIELSGITAGNLIKRWTPSRFSNSFRNVLARRRDFILNVCKEEKGGAI